MGVEDPSTLDEMTKSTRALSDVQSERIRRRFRELYPLTKRERQERAAPEDGEQRPSQDGVAKAMGISQQAFGRILNGRPAGFYVAQKLARFDGVPVEAILDGIPRLLEVTIRENPRRWSPPTIAAARKLVAPGPDQLEAGPFESYRTDAWVALLDRVEATLAPIVSDLRRKPRKRPTSKMTRE